MWERHTISLLKSLKRRPSFGVVDPTSSTPFLFIAHPRIHLWKSHLIPTMCWAQYNKFECLSYALEAQKPCGRYRRAINCWDRLPQSCAQFVGAKRKGTYVRPTLGTFFRGSGRVKAKVAQSSPTLCNSMDYTVLGILLARILEGVAYPFSKGSPQPRDQTQISHTALDSLPAEPPRKPKNTGVGSLSFLQQIFLTQESNRGQTCNAGRFFTNWAIREAFRGSKMSLNSNMWGVKVYPDINLQYCKKLLHQRIFVIKLLPYIYMPYIYI